MFHAIFCIDVTFEMRTVLSRIRLFSDTFLDIRHHVYIKQKRRGREQDSGETERERERESERRSIVDRGGSISCKTDHWRNF